MLTKHSALAKDQRNAANPVMQHRHFAVVAGLVASLDPYLVDEVAGHFADHLGKTNPKFNRARFIAACNVNRK
jgi:hypothetical protein